MKKRLPIVHTTINNDHIFSSNHEVLTFESVDEILWCDHSNENSSAVLLHGNICFSVFYKIKFLNFDF